MPRDWQSYLTVCFFLSLLSVLYFIALEKEFNASSNNVTFDDVKIRTRRTIGKYILDLGNCPVCDKIKVGPGRTEKVVVNECKYILQYFLFNFQFKVCLFKLCFLIQSPNYFNIDIITYSIYAKWYMQNNIRLMALFSWEPIFVDCKNDTCMALVFSFIINIENYYFVGIGIWGSDPPQKPRKLVPHEI